MTEQSPDQLDNRYAAVDFGELKLYDVIIGDVNAGNPYRFRTKPSVPDGSGTCSALWRGYIAEFALAHDGRLILYSYHFPFAPNQPRKTDNERIVGDFSLVMQSRFPGNRVYVPFRNSIIVPDENDWVIEGDDSLESLKHPCPPKQFLELKKTRLDEPVFVGIVASVTFDLFLEDHPWIVLDREIPEIYHRCKVEVRHDGVLTSESRICGSSGGHDGPWMLQPPIESMLAIGGHVFAVDRWPTYDEAKRQIEEWSL